MIIRLVEHVPGRVERIDLELVIPHPIGRGVEEDLEVVVHIDDAVALVQRPPDVFFLHLGGEVPRKPSSQVG